MAIIDHATRIGDETQRQSFAEPIGAAETIKRYIGKLVGKMCLILEERGLGARRLDLICHRVDSHFQAIRVGTALPSKGQFPTWQQQNHRPQSQP